MWKSPKFVLCYGTELIVPHTAALSQGRFAWWRDLQIDWEPLCIKNRYRYPTDCVSLEQFYGTSSVPHNLPFTASFHRLNACTRQSLTEYRDSARREDNPSHHLEHGGCTRPGRADYQLNSRGIKWNRRITRMATHRSYSPARRMDTDSDSHL